MQISIPVLMLISAVLQVPSAECFQRRNVGEALGEEDLISVIPLCASSLSPVCPSVSLPWLLLCGSL